MEYRTTSYAEEYAKDNSILRADTQKWELRVRPWYNMDRIKFSFIQIGTKGKGDSFNVVMDITRTCGAPSFQKWVNDILSGRIERKLAAEKNNGITEPTSYKYVTGENATKSIGIANSTKGEYCIKGSCKRGEKWINTYIPVDLGDLVIMAKAFEASYAERRAYLESLRKEAEAANEKFYAKEDEAEAKEEAKEIAKEEAQTPAPVKEDAPAEPATVSTTQQMPDIAPENFDIPSQIRVVVSKPSKGEGEYIFTGKNVETGDEETLHAPFAIMTGEQKDLWKKLADALEKSSRTVTFIINDGDKKVIEKIA